MSRVRIENDQLVITMQGARKFFSMKSEISVPISSVQTATTGLEWRELPRAWEKVIGTNSMSFYHGGTFCQDGDRVFFDLRKKEEAVVITLADEDFKRIIIGVDDPAATVELIQQALNGKNN